MCSRVNSDTLECDTFWIEPMDDLKEHPNMASKQDTQQQSILFPIQWYQFGWKKSVIHSSHFSKVLFLRYGGIREAGGFFCLLSMMLFDNIFRLLRDYWLSFHSILVTVEWNLSTWYQRKGFFYRYYCQLGYQPHGVLYIPGHAE